MFADSFVKYSFRIRTRTGSIVENLTIHGRDENEAQKKLRQMYPRLHLPPWWRQSPSTKL
jgi:hypothetical protein